MTIPGTLPFEILLSKVTADLQRRKISIYQDDEKNDTKFLLSFDHPSSSSLSSLNYINIDPPYNHHDKKKTSYYLHPWTFIQ